MMAVKMNNRTGGSGDGSGTGPAGPRGPAGRDGVNGKDGRDGVDGKNGTDGAPGAVGTSSTATAATPLPANAFVYIKADGKLALADASGEGQEAVGFVRAACAAGALATFYTAGNVMTGLAGLTPGASYFLSTTPGQAVPRAQLPAAAGNVVQEVGVALTDMTLLFNPGTPITV